MKNKTPPLRKNENVSLKIDALGSEGQGIGRVDGYTLFVPGALPGEEVRAHVIKAGSSFGVAKLIEITLPVEGRVMPPCPRSGVCGGCTLQHLSYEGQLSYKRRVVTDALSRIGGLYGVEAAPVIGMEEPYYYRNKASFPFADTLKGIDIGFFAQRSHRLVQADDCLLQRPGVMEAALTVRDWAREYELTAYDEGRHSGLLRHVIAREGSGGDVMVIVVATEHLPHKKELIRALRARAEHVKSIYHNLNTAKSNAILGDDFRLLYGSPSITETIQGLTFELGPASFLQVNHVQAERLYTEALNALSLKGCERVVDAYCGIGTITLQLALRADEVVGLEYMRESVLDAMKNAKANGITNARFIDGPAEHTLPGLIAEGFRPDALVLDPPRKGADEAFLKAVIDSGVKRVVYISCNPATLARDLNILHAGGYAIDTALPIDLFPQTPHIETVTALHRT